MLLGHFSIPEFQPVADAIGHFAQVDTAHNCKEAAARLQSGRPTVDLVVVAERWPGEHAHGQLDRVQRAAPLVRLLAIGSSWCEGQQRSGNPWPGMLQMGWQSWLPHWQTDFVRLLGF